MQIALGDWLAETVELGTFQSAEDAHISDFNVLWRNPDTWPTAIDQCLREANLWIREQAASFEVAIGMSLSRVVSSVELEDSPLDKVHCFRTDEPPLLCLFPEDKRPWDSLVSQLRGECEIVNAGMKRVFVCHFWDRWENDRRGYVWIIETPKGDAASDSVV
jgi:hypothetical protein